MSREGRGSAGALLPPRGRDPDIDVVEELRDLFGEDGRQRPVQFSNLVSGCQYLPLYALTRQHARPGLRALDWGSGNGHFSYFLLRIGLEVTGFNLLSQPCDLAPILKKRFGERYRFEAGPADEPARLPFADASFDLVFSVGVLEHVRETGGTETASLREIRRILVPGGRFVCGFLPRRHSWIEFAVRQLAPGKHQHVWRYQPDDVRRLLAAADLELLELATHGFLPRNSLSTGALTPLHDRRAVARAFNRVDRGLARPFAPIAQNLMFVAKKPIS